MKKLQILLYTLLVWTASACVSEFNAQLPTSDVDLLVVEGNIVSDSVINFYFSKSFSLNEGTPPAGYDNIQVKLRIVGSDGFKSEYATYRNNGVHSLAIGKLNTDVAYGIEFEYNGDTYLSELSQPLHTPVIDSISWVQPEYRGDVSLRVSTHNEDPKASYFMWNYTEDWEITSFHGAYAFFDEKFNIYLDYSLPIFYCWRKNSSKDILVGSTEKLTENRIINHNLYKKTPNDDRFSVLYSVVVTQQAISKAGYEYYLDKAKGNVGMGGLFTPQPSKIEGNINCITDPDKKVIGHIEVAQNATSYRIFISAAQISSFYRESCEEIDKDSINTLLGQGLTYQDIYNMGLRPWIYSERDGVLESMASRTCLDCTARGTKNKPDFWPNNHQ